MKKFVWIPPQSCRRNTIIDVLEEEVMTFQQMDSDHYITQTDFQLLGSLAKKQGKNPTRSTNSMMAIPNTVALMRLYGVNASGNSVLAHVHGYRPYFYVKAPPGFDPSVCEEFRNLLNIALNKRVPSFSNDKERKRKRKEEEFHDDDDYNNDGQLSNRFSSPELETYVISVEPCKKQTIWNYQTEENCDFLKIYFSLPQHMSVARRILESGINFPRIGPCTFLTFESDVSYVMRYMVDSGIVGASWITIHSFLMRSDNKKTSNCQVISSILSFIQKKKKTN